MLLHYKTNLRGKAMSGWSVKVEKMNNTSNSLGFLIAKGLLCTIFAAVAFSLITVEDTHAAYSVVDTSDSPVSTEAVAQRRVFHDTKNNTFWSFYYNGHGIEFAASHNGQDWNPVGTLPYVTTQFSVAHQEIAGTSYVFVAVTTPNYDIVVRRATLGVGTASFSQEFKALDSTPGTDRYVMPTIGLDGSGHIWVAGVRVIGVEKADNRRVRVIRSSNTGAGNLSSWQASTDLGRQIGLIQDLVLLPQGGANMFLLVNIDAPDIVAFRYDGSSWSPANTGGGYSWFTAFTNGVDAQVHALLVNGDDVYVGGAFRDVAGRYGDAIVRWDGATWHPLGTGLSGHVLSLAMIGEHLYAGGTFGIRRWDGHIWENLGQGIAGHVRALAVKGTELYAAGRFDRVDGEVGYNNVARWDGTDWYRLRNGITGELYAAALFQNQIIFGGEFQNLDGNASIDRVAAWDGSNWQPMNAKLDAPVYVFKVVENDLYMGGSFSDLNDNDNIDRIARYDGSTWYQVGEPLNGTVFAIAVSDEYVYAGGIFTEATNTPSTRNIDFFTRWDGSQWEQLGPNGFRYGCPQKPREVYVLEMASDNVGVYIGGKIIQAAGTSHLDHFLLFNGTNYVRQGASVGFDGRVNDMLIRDGRVYVAGAFDMLNLVPGADGIAYWDGISWNALGEGVQDQQGNPGEVYSLEFYNNQLHIAGTFASADWDPMARGVARWDGAGWRDLNTGHPTIYRNGGIFTLKSHGGSLYAGGNFNTLGGAAGATRIARWDGADWHEIDSVNHVIPNGVIWAVEFVNGEMFIGGQFRDLGGVDENDAIARWDGSHYQPLRTGIPNNGVVYVLKAIGDDLWVGGRYDDAGENEDAKNIAVWDGENWNALGIGLNNAVLEITPAGSRVYVGGDFSDAGSEITADRIAFWEDRNWHPVGSGMNGQVKAINVIDDVVFAGGAFTSPINNPLGSKYFSKFREVSLVDTDETTKISSLTDSQGDVHLLYTDRNDDLKYKRFSGVGGAWASPITVSDTGKVANGTLMLLRETNQLFAAWDDTSILYGKLAEFPFGINQWSHEQVAMLDSGTNHAISGQAHGAIGASVVIWTNGHTVPYRVLSEAIIDTDGDSIIDPLDPDDDGDGLDDSDEETIGTDPMLPDSDGDGVNDGQEELDGTDPTDPGSLSTQLESPVYSLWNSFLSMVNILELINNGTTDMTVTVSLFKIDGQLGSSVDVNLAPRQQFDVILNDMKGFEVNSYGLVKIEYDGLLDGRVFFYRRSEGLDAYDFAFGVPLSRPSYGRTAVGFNTFQPSLDPLEAQSLVANWLTAVNLSPQTKGFTIEKYNQLGELLSSSRVEIPGFGRVDVDGGHVNPGPLNVGFNEIIPDDPDSPYIGQLMRYGNNASGGYNFAFPLAAKAGTGRTIHVPISRDYDAQNWLEVVNTKGEAVTATVECRAADGTILRTWPDLDLAQRFQKHLNVSELLGMDESGVCTITPSARNSIIAQSMYYFRDSSSGSMLAMYGSQARESLGIGLYGSYNLFLGMNSTLRVMNPTEKNVSFLMEVFGYNGTLSKKNVIVPALGSVDLYLHDTRLYGTQADTYGVVTLSNRVAGDILAEVLRTRGIPGTSQLDFRAPTEVR